MVDPSWLTATVAATLAGWPRLGSVRLLTVDGPSGSGKSTVAAALAECFPVQATLVPTDHFSTWDDPFDWWPQLEIGVLQPLSAGQPGHYLANDWTSGQPVARFPIAVEVPQVLILEGVSAGRRQIRDRTTLSCWVELPDRVLRLERAVARDGERSRQPLSRWQEDEDQWFTADRARDRADRILMVG